MPHLPQTRGFASVVKGVNLFLKMCTQVVDFAVIRDIIKLKTQTKEVMTMTKKQQAKEAALRAMDAAQAMVVKHSISRNDNARQADLVLFTEMAIQLLTSGLRQARTTQAQIEVLTNTLVSEMNALMDCLHGQAMDMNEQYAAQLAEIQNIEYSATVNADLVKVCSMRVFFYQRYMFDRAYDLVSYSKIIEPLFDLLDAIATELAGYPVSASEHNWIVIEAAHGERYEREEAAWKVQWEVDAAELTTRGAARKEAQAATANPYEILLNIMGEDAFCKAILKPEAYEAYLIRKAEDAPGTEEEQEAILIEMNEHHHGYTRHEGEIVGETFDDLWPARPTGFENELKKIW